MPSLRAYPPRSITPSGLSKALGAGGLLAVLGLLAMASPASAQAAVPLNTGDTAWMLTATALVLMMMVPGLGLFYGGMVRSKNLISVVAQTFAIAGVLSVLWTCIGYSLAFSSSSPSLMPFIGGVSHFLMDGVALDKAHPLAPTIPEPIYFTFQMTFAIITPALVIGAFAERMKFSAVLLFMCLWLLLVYVPVAHWVWGGGFLGGLGVLDFAGGTVVHINAGVAGLVCCLVLGKRVGYGHDQMPPTNVVYTAVGAGLLWVGWFGFNAGSAGGASVLAGVAMMNTQIATAAALCAWMAIEWALRRRATLLGMVSGAIAGLVAITPACGFVTPKSALIIGFAAGGVCYWSAVWLKHKLGYDDTLDIWGIHGVGGILGALMTGIFADGSVNPAAAQHSLTSQAIGVGSTVLISSVMTGLILLICRFTTGLRVSEEQELEGLNTAAHGEAIYP